MSPRPCDGPRDGSSTSLTSRQPELELVRVTLKLRGTPLKGELPVMRMSLERLDAPIVNLNAARARVGALIHWHGDGDADEIDARDPRLAALGAELVR